MKLINLLVFLVSFLYVGSTYAIIAAPYSNSFDNSGSIVFKDRVSIKVRNMTGTAIAKGSIVRADVATYDDVASVSLFPANSPNVVPLCVADETIAAASGSMGKCLVYGYHPGLLYDVGSSNAVAGEPAFVGAVTVPGYAIAITTGNQQTYSKSVGAFLDDASATGSVEAFINLL